MPGQRNVGAVIRHSSGSTPAPTMRTSRSLLLMGRIAAPVTPLSSTARKTIKSFAVRRRNKLDKESPDSLPLNV